MAKSSVSPSLPGQPRIGRQNGMMLWLIAALVASGLVMLLGAVLSLPQRNAIEEQGLIQAQDLPLAGDKTMQSLPGFQRRGTLHVAELRAQDGSLIRLVLDAKSLKLIGVKRLEAAPIR